MLLLPIEPRILELERSRRNTEPSAMFVMARCQLLLSELDRMTKFCLRRPDSGAASWLGAQIVEWTARVQKVQRGAERCLYH